MRKHLFFSLAIICLLGHLLWAIDEDDIPVHISVLPVFFVPKGEAKPDLKHIEMVQKHLEITQQYYKSMLKERDTFTIAEMEPQILHDARTLTSLQKLDSKRFGHYLLNRLLSQFEANRFNCPYVFLVIIMCPQEAWPTAGGRPINEGFNGGAGFAVFSSNKLDEPNPLIQGSFQHELGHAFGLPHVDTYGYDQYKNKSIMSYNKANYWSGLNPPTEAAIMIPEDIRGLSMNKRVFPNLYFDSQIDIPQGYKLGKMVRLSFDSSIPGQKDYSIKVTSESGQVRDTNPQNVVLAYIRPNSTLVPNAMWMSDKTKNEWIDLQLEFPIPVRMNRIRAHSQCGGLYPVTAIKAEAEMGTFKEVAVVENITSDKIDVCFEETKAQRWRLYFKPDKSGQVVLRGVQFFSSAGEIFCPKFPTYLMECKTWPMN